MKQDIFYETTCLTEKSSSLSGLNLNKKWFKGADKRYLGETLQKFIQYNKQLFDFLEVTPFIEGSGRDVSISFKTGKYIGTIPLKSPETGKQIGDFVIKPRFSSKNDQFSEYIEIIDLIKNEIKPEFKDSLPLNSGDHIKPPMYLEAVIFMDLLNKVLKTQWKKFQNTEKIYSYPKSQVNWKKYINKESNPAYKLIFPCNENTLTQYHKEFSQIKYVYQLTKEEIQSYQTPQSIKYQKENLIQYIDNALYQFNTSFVTEIKTHNYDSLLIKELKTQANKILKRNSFVNIAWKVDFSEVFEKFTQYIFNQASLKIGARSLDNHKFKNSSNYSPSWILNYLEPDIILIKDNLNIIIDAKYKAHMQNLSSNSTDLKEEHRKDLHQLLAYCSFNDNKNKIGFLCYPSNKITKKVLNYRNNLNQVSNIVFLIGIPMRKTEIQNTIDFIIEIINAIEKSIP